MKLASAGQAFGVWNSKENTFRFKVPSGTCKAEVTFTGTQGVHEFHFTSHNSEASFVPWAHYDYDYNNEAFLLDQACAKRGTHPDIVDLPFPRIQGLANFHNPTRPSHLVNGSLVKRRRLYTPNEIRSTPVQESHRRMHDGPASFTRAQSVQGRPVNRTPPRRHMTRSLSRSRSISPRRLRSRQSPAPRPRPGVASHNRSRSRSPHGNPPRYVSKPAWLVIRDKLSDEDFAFIKDILAYVKGERALLKFAQKCDIPDIPLKWAIRNHVNSFTDAIPYDTIEQVFIVWWVNTNKPAYWKANKLRTGFDALEMPGAFTSVLSRHPNLSQGDPNHQPGTSRNTRAHLPINPHNITSRYAEIQMSSNETSLIRRLSVLINSRELINGLAEAVSVSPGALSITEKMETVYGLPQEELFMRMAYFVLVTWYALEETSRPTRLSDLRRIFFGLDLDQWCDEILRSHGYRVEIKNQGREAIIMGCQALKALRSGGLRKKATISIVPENYFTSPGAHSFIPQGRGEGAVLRSEVEINNQQETIEIEGEGQIENMGESTNQTSGTNTIRFRISQENNEKGAEGNTPPNPYISLKNIDKKQKNGKQVQKGVVLQTNV